MGIHIPYIFFLSFLAQRDENMSSQISKKMLLLHKSWGNARLLPRRLLLIVGALQLTAGAHDIESSWPPDRSRNSQVLDDAREADNVVSRRADVLAARPRVEGDQVDVRGDVSEQISECSCFLEAVIHILQHDISTRAQRV